MIKNKKILVSGAGSRFCFFLKKNLLSKNVMYFNKKDLDILDFHKLIKTLRKKKIKIFIHVAALSRPMNIHDKNIFALVMCMPSVPFVFMTVAGCPSPVPWLCGMQSRPGRL